jgi:hypothetical protein
MRDFPVIPPSLSSPGNGSVNARDSFIAFSYPSISGAKILDKERFAKNIF